MQLVHDSVITESSRGHRGIEDICMPDGVAVGDIFYCFWPLSSSQTSSTLFSTTVFGSSSRFGGSLRLLWHVSIGMRCNLTMNKHNGRFGHRRTTTAATDRNGLLFNGSRADERDVGKAVESGLHVTHWNRHFVQSSAFLVSVTLSLSHAV